MQLQEKLAKEQRWLNCEEEVEFLSLGRKTLSVRPCRPGLVVGLSLKSAVSTIPQSGKGPSSPALVRNPARLQQLCGGISPRLIYPPISFMPSDNNSRKRPK